MKNLSIYLCLCTFSFSFRLTKCTISHNGLIYISSVDVPTRACMKHDDVENQKLLPASKTFNTCADRKTQNFAQKS